MHKYIYIYLVCIIVEYFTLEKKRSDIDIYIYIIK